MPSLNFHVSDIFQCLGVATTNAVVHSNHRLVVLNHESTSNFTFEALDLDSTAKNMNSNRFLHWRTKQPIPISLETTIARKLLDLSANMKNRFPHHLPKKKTRLYLSIARSGALSAPEPQRMQDF